MFAHQRIPTKDAGDAWVTLTKNHIQREDAFTARQLLGFFVENLSDPCKKRVFDEIDQRFVHPRFRREVAVQGGLRYTKVTRQFCGGDLASWARLQHLCQCLKDLLFSTALFLGHGIRQCVCGIAIMGAQPYPSSCL